jgi:hypothetical protein
LGGFFAFAKNEYAVQRFRAETVASGAGVGYLLRIVRGVSKALRLIHANRILKQEKMLYIMKNHLILS